jgi:crossover junction endodeoxyribonuclease RuvC
LIVLGIDPGLATVGYGVIKAQNQAVSVVDYGAIITPKEENTAVRLAMIDEAVCKLIEKFKPDAVAIEELFFNTNVTTGIKVAMARGVLLAAVVKSCSELYEYTPLQIKQAMVGYGRADKKQVQEMVRIILKLKSVPRPDDAADALAIALTHIQSGRLSETFRV